MRHTVHQVRGDESNIFGAGEELRGVQGAKLFYGHARGGVPQAFALGGGLAPQHSPLPYSATLTDSVAPMFSGCAPDDGRDYFGPGEVPHFAGTPPARSTVSSACHRGAASAWQHQSSHTAAPAGSHYSMPV